MICSVDGCLTRSESKGMCDKHYTRWRRHGNPHTVKDYSKRTLSKQKNGEAYVMVRVGDAYKGEHIIIAEKALGKALPPKAVVHHMDRDGENNNTKSPWNLVVCPDQNYHMLLHARARALGYEPLRSGDKLNGQQVAEIKKSNSSRRELARIYGVSIHTVKAIRSGRRPDHLQERR